MKRVILFSLIVFLLIPAKVFSQQDSGSDCNCFFPLDTLSYSRVPFTLGIDPVTPPYYWNNVNTSQKMKLPFKFCFYGTNYDSIYIGNKGNITFIKPVFKFTKNGFPAGTDTAMIAPFWANIDDTNFGPGRLGSGQVWYKIFPGHIVIRWNTMGFCTFDDDLYDSFQLIISNGTDSAIPGGNNVQFCYEKGNMYWASADSSGGSMGFNGIPATVGINKGDGSTYAVISRFKLPGLSFYGPDSANNGLYWLEGKSFTLNTCVTEKNIPPVIINSNGNLCDTFDVCRWDSVKYTAYFLCTEQGQKATLSASAPALAGLVTDTSSGPDKIYTITVHAGIGPATPGYHIINITATDNSTPPQTSTHPIVVHVNVCDGVSEVSKDNDAFTVYPNASNGIFNVELASSQQLIAESFLEIYDVLGREVYSGKLTERKSEIDLSSQSKGVYFLKLYNGNTRLGVKKIIIQ